MRSHLRLVNSNDRAPIFKKHRPIFEIAKDIRADWIKINPYANEYLRAMLTIDQIDDYYLLDSAEGIVLRFLSNARGWHGEKAKAIKKEILALAELVDRKAPQDNCNKAYASEVLR
jgi:hypothetical protein